MAAPKVLIADDDTKLLAALKLRLEAAGFEVVTSQDAYQALDLARRHCPDVLILDVNMPAGTGLSVQERVLRIDELADTPIVYVSGASGGEACREAKRLGAFAYLRKPFDMPTLIATVRAAAKRRAQRRSHAA